MSNKKGDTIVSFRLFRGNKQVGSVYEKTFSYEANAYKWATKNDGKISKDYYNCKIYVDSIQNFDCFYTWH